MKQEPEATMSGWVKTQPGRQGWLPATCLSPVPAHRNSVQGSVAITPSLWGPDLGLPSGWRQDCCISAPKHRLPESTLMGDPVKSASLGPTSPCLFSCHTTSLTVVQESLSMSAFATRLHALNSNCIHFFNLQFPKLYLVQSRCSINLHK